jgi:hypothetical protein
LDIGASVNGAEMKDIFGDMVVNTNGTGFSSNLAVYNPFGSGASTPKSV